MIFSAEWILTDANIGSVVYEPVEAERLKGWEN